MNKKKIIFGAIILVIVTAFSTLAGLYALLGMDQLKISNTLRFFYAMRFIESQYVNDVNDTNLINGAISGMMKSLDDPHSVYLDDVMYQELMKHTKGSFGGIGIVMGSKDNQITVVSPIEGTPGAEAGIKTGDIIVKIDGEDTKAMTLEDAAAKIRGDIGTKVVLTIRRVNENDRDYELTRANIEVNTVASTVMDNNIGYIRIANFSEHTGKELEKAYHELEGKGIKGIVLDLRNNPGGLLTASVEAANLFVPKGKVVSTIKRDGSREEYTSSLESLKYPVAVLVNGGSASASEILAGAIQDTQSGTLVGTKTYGKGSVQVVMPLYSGDALKLTIAKYYTPNDRCIDGIGIEPDVNVEPAGSTDNQLAKAIEVVKQKIK